MPIPPYTLDGVLPPYTGGQGPPVDDSQLMSPYKVTMSEVIQHFATSAERKKILVDWLKYRAELRGLGILEGFHWLGGSFVEDKEQFRGSAPDDLDLVVFFRRPKEHETREEFRYFAQSNMKSLRKREIKRRYALDAFLIDLGTNPETIVAHCRYYLQLYSHQQDTGIWKGMLQVRHDDAEDDAALLARLEAELAGGRP